MRDGSDDGPGCDMPAVSDRGRRLWTGIGLGSGAVLLVFEETWRWWWPLRRAIEAWLATWWWAVVAASVVVVAVREIRASRQPTRRRAGASSVVWERTSDQLGLVARSTVESTGSRAAAAGDSGRRNWSAFTSAITAFTALAAVAFTAQSLSATRDQISLSEQGQITDRYTTAIDQIGTQGVDHLETRLGGIYALERLARDSPRDQSTIVEVLTAFVRGGVPRVATLADGSADLRTCSSGPDLSLDIQAALTVLGRRDIKHDNGAQIDLNHACLPYADLTGANLANTNLAWADLAGANLGGAHLSHASLAGADLSGANLSRSYYISAHRSGLYLGGADLTGADLTGTHLIRANLADADLNGANLTGARLVGADLSAANLTGATLVSAHVNDANLAGANVSDADLMHTDLSDADLSNAVHNALTKTAGAVKTGARGAWW